MIPDSSVAAITDAQKVPQWRLELAAAIKSPQQLIAALKLDLSQAQQEAAKQAAQQFPLRVTQSFLNRIQPGKLNDPLLQQILPLGAELLPSPGFSNDPVGDLSAMPTPGVLHKYHGRALLVTTAACGIHCRYCFRRAFPYPSANPAKSAWDHAIDYLSNNPSIYEVILSGGDPLSLPDDRLARLCQKLEQIPHLTRIRLHTRMPIILPSRINDELIAWITSSRLKPVIVVHINHAQEIDHEVKMALQRLRQHSIHLFNQTVLLKGINDSVSSLAELSEALFESAVIPYYLHLLDRVNGAAHFEVPITQARRIMKQLRERLPGYLVPTLVREKAGAPAKIPVL